MSKFYLTSDLHLGHKNIAKYRTNFSSSEEHHEIVFDNLASTVNKEDTLVLLGDIAFTKEWLGRIARLEVKQKILIVGNHDLEFGLHMRDLVKAYDAIYGLWSKKNYWFSHSPIHPQEMRDKKGNIHGHSHERKMVLNWEEKSANLADKKLDTHYVNVCIEHTDWKPILFADAVQERV